jgi:hypothetical protein
MTRPDPVFGLRVLAERRRLADYDPDGEAEAVEALRPIWDLIAEADGLVALADIEPTRVEWLWPGYIPLGKLTILDGDPGLGKSTILLDLAARASRGETTPTGTPLGTFSTIVITAEDDAADTIRPRLDVAGGDPSRVYHLAKLTLPDEADRLARLVDRTAARLVVIDPLVAYLADGVKTNSDHEVRRALEPVAAMAERLHIAVVAIRHLNKQSGGDAIYRGGGSIGFTGLARAVLAVGRDPDDEDRIVLAAVKVNVARRPPSLAYRLVAEGDYEPARVQWEGESAHTAESLIGRDRDGTVDVGKADKLAATIRELVAANGGQMLARDAYRALEADGVDTENKNLLYRARQKAGVEVTKTGMDRGWLWSLAA